MLASFAYVLLDLQMFFWYLNAKFNAEPRLMEYVTAAIFGATKLMQSRISEDFQLIGDKRRFRFPTRKSDLDGADQNI